MKKIIHIYESLATSKKISNGNNDFDYSNVNDN